MFATSCRVTKPAKNQDTKDTLDATSIVKDTLPEAPPIYITQKGDTLENFEEEVAIALERVLPDSVSVAAVGDIMMGTNFPNAAYLPADSGAYLWNDTRGLLSAADITFGNLEGTILDGEGDPKECKNPKACYLFRMPSYLSAHLVESGFDLLSLANNHANDFGIPGRKSTQRILDSIGISHAGAIEQPYTVSLINGLYIGFVAFAPNKGTLLFHNQQKALEIIHKLDSITDIVFVSIHGGAEGAKNQHITREREFYFGEDRGNIYEFSHLLIDNGADIILGHGPHVARAIEVYKNKLIAYSLGNFLTYGRFNLKAESGLAPLLVAHLSPTGEFLSGRIHAFRQSYTNGPIKDPLGQAITTIKKLSEEDFPENEIIIEEDGRIFYIQN